MKILKEGTKVKYVDYTGEIIDGIIQHVGFKNKTNTVIWYSVRFAKKAFLVDGEKLILNFTNDEQLSIF